MKLIVLILVRICNAICITTYFNPDEYWQGPEIAHHMVFQYGYKYENFKYLICYFTLEPGNGCRNIN